MQETSDVITSPAGAFDVFDFEEAAHRKVLQAALGVHGERRRRRRDAPRQSRRFQAHRIASAPVARRHQSGHARRSVWHDVQQPDFPVPHRRREIVLPRWRIGRGAGGKSARNFAVSIHGHLDARRRREQRTRPAGLVSTVRNDLLGCERENSAARGSRGLPGRRAHGRQHHGPLQRNLSPHSRQGPAPVPQLPRNS